MARRKLLTRAEGMTQISISLPQSLVSQIDKMAELDNRNRSNFIANTLQNLVKDYVSVAETRKKLKQ